MKIIAITQEDFFDEEAETICFLLDKGGIDTLHLRKPAATSDNLQSLLKHIPSQYYRHIILHEHFELIHKFPLKGIHLNRRNPHSPIGYQGYTGRSCHSIEELKSSPKTDYCFLSPIFDSISKKGYRAGFSEKELTAASRSGTIDNSVVALGGITPDRLPILKKYKFGGAAFLGYLWNVTDKDELIKRLDEIKYYNR